MTGATPGHGSRSSHTTTPTAGAGGSLRVVARVCPKPTATPTAATPGAAAQTCRPYPDGAAPMLTDASGNAWGLDASRDAAGAAIYSKSGLAFGEYALGDPRIPDGYDDYRISGPGIAERDGRFSVTLDAAHPSADLTVSFLQTGLKGAAAVAVFDCPAGMTAATLAKDACQPAEGRLDVQLVGSAPETVLTARDSVQTRRGEGIRWQRLRVSADGVAYRVEWTRPSSLKPPFVAVVGTETVAADAADGVAFTLSPTRPDVAIEIYRFHP